VFAFIFDSVGFGEWFLLLAVVLIVVGPKKLPSAARTIGGYYAKFRRAAEGFKRQLMDMETEFTKAAEEAEKGVDAAFKSEGDESTAVPSSTAGDVPASEPAYATDVPPELATTDTDVPPEFATTDAPAESEAEAPKEV